MKKEKLTSRWSLKKPYIIKRDDKRYKKCLKELKETGISYDEMWSLDCAICEFLIPRLKMFRRNKGGHPACFKSDEEWNEVLDKMIYAFEWSMFEVNNCGKYNELTDEAIEDGWKKYEEGMKLFSDNFRGLWY